MAKIKEENGKTQKQKKFYKNPEREPQPREYSIGTVYTYAGSLKDLQRSTEKERTHVCERSFSGNTGCLNIDNAQYFYMLKNTVILWHAPRGCEMWIVFIRQMIDGAERVSGDKVSNHRIVTTDINSDDIVYGGEEKLRKTLLWCDQKYEPELIVVIPACATGIIGDDLDGVVKGVKDKVKAEVVVVHGAGYRSVIHGYCYDLGAHLWVYQLMEEPKKKEKDLINVITPWTCSMTDLFEIKRVLEKAKIRVRFFPKFSTLKDIKKAPEAAANAMICVTYGLPFVEFMNHRFGTPYSSVNQVCGITQTSSWYRGIAELVGKEKEMEGIIKEEEKEWIEKLQPIKEYLKGKTVYIAGSHARAPHLMTFCAELGMEVVGMNVFYWDKPINPDLEKALGVLNKDIIVSVGIGQVNEELPILHQLKPDLYIGDAGAGLMPAKYGQLYMGIQAADKKSFRYGYGGAYAIAREMAQAIANPNYYRRIGKYYHVHKKSWLEGNPFRFIPEKMNRFSEEKNISEILAKIEKEEEVS